MTLSIVETGSFAVADISIEGRLREVDPAHVAVIASTIEASGQQHPIILRKKGNRLVLVTGSHRVAAIKLLGRSDVMANLVEAPDGVDADAYFRDLEIIENIARNDLSPLDRAIHLGEMLKAEGLQYKRGGDRKAEQTKTFRLIGDAAEKLQVSRRSVQQYLALYKDLSPKAIARLKGTDLADNFSELRKLAAEKPEDQVAILDLMDVEEGEEAPANVASASALHHNKVDTTSPDEKHMAAFIKLWAKASKKARKQMLAYAEKNMGV